MQPLLLALLLSCSHETADTGAWPASPRAAGERAPRTADCDELDPHRCLLPWPSSAFERLDDSSSTGLRLAVHPSSLREGDDASFLDLADGFSRVTGLATAFEGEVEPEDSGKGACGAKCWDLDLETGLRLFVAEPGEHWGEEVFLRTELVYDEAEDLSLLVGRPYTVLPPGSELLAVVTDRLRGPGGSALEPDHLARVALALEPPSSEEEAALRDYAAPWRELLDELSASDSRLRPEHLLRLWDFHTRSAEDPRRALDTMLAAVDEAAASLEPVLDEVEWPEEGSPIAVIVTGHLEGMPNFREGDGGLALDGDGLPVAQGTTEAPFRVVVPAGDGDYPVALYGHGTAGSLDDDAFDEEIASQGVAKVNVRWRGWTGDEFLETVASFSHVLHGTAVSTAGLLQSIAEAHAVLRSLPGALGELLAAEELEGQPNPAAGRRPSLDTPLWVGGSQGGTLGAVVTAAEEDIRYAVLNVPGGGWSHFIPGSYFEEAFFGALLEANYDGAVDQALALLTSQGEWDPVDGTSWAERSREDGDMLLLQESVCDPVLPNIGTELLAAAEGAVLVEPYVELVFALDTAPGPFHEGAVLEQFRVPQDESPYAIHGFADRDTVAGEAAREQILGFLSSALAGEPTIEHPPTCSEQGAGGACDFLDAW